MFATQTRDLYHIAINRKGDYIEFADRQIYRAERSEVYRQQIPSVKEKRTKSFKTLRPFLYGFVLFFRRYRIMPYKKRDTFELLHNS